MSQAYSHATVAAAFEIAAKTTTIALTKRAFEFAILRDNQMYSYDGWSFIQHMNELWIEGEVDGQKRYRMAEHLGFGWVSGASLEVV